MAKITVGVTENERRKDRRREVLMDGRLEGHAVKLLDISFGGLRAVLEISGNVDYAPAIGEEVELVIETQSGAEISFTVVPIRFEEKDGTFGARFDSLTDAQFRALEKLTLGRKL